METTIPGIGRFCALLGIAAVAAVPAPDGALAASVSIDTAVADACDIWAWSSDEDPKGLNVRAAPRADAPVLGRLPAPRQVDGYSFAVEVRIIGSRNGWFLIDRAEFADYGDPGQAGVVFEGKGWVSGRLLSLTAGGQAIRAESAETSKKIVDLVGEDGNGNAYGPDSLIVERVHACRGEWAEVEGVLGGPNTRHRGWVTGICSNQATTCP